MVPEGITCVLPSPKSMLYVKASVALAVMVTDPVPFPFGLEASTPTKAVVSVKPVGVLINFL